jgi:ribosome-associated heat shock protein Hsp15
MNGVRIDRWLWAVRITRTRAMASDLCSRGKVRVNGQRAKASRNVRQGDRIEVGLRGTDRLYEVLKTIDKRVGARVAAECKKDLTPAVELEKAKRIRVANRPFFRRDKGAGRPTKRERRRLDRIKGQE